ncbi:MAG: hypothetical protein PHG00_09605 [Methylococcales bacterium]|nr:hypothetical protein [Methylococcales bacterium]
MLLEPVYAPACHPHQRAENIDEGQKLKTQKEKQEHEGKVHYDVKIAQDIDNKVAAIIYL